MIELEAQFDIDDPLGSYVERWSTRTPGRSALVIRSSEHLDFLDRAMRERAGAIHARVATIHEVVRRDDQLWVVVDDERGPLLAEAAAALRDPVERERWTIAQIIGIAEACMALRAVGIAPALGGDEIVVSIGGHARLRAPIATPPIDPRTLTRTGPMPNLERMSTASPEAARGLPLTPATDVFSLAAHVHRALTGSPPFADENPMAMLVAIILNAAPALPAQTLGLAGVVARAFEKEPAARYRDAGVFAEALRACAPDAADYDQVISDRIVAWRESL